MWKIPHARRWLPCTHLPSAQHQQQRSFNRTIEPRDATTQTLALLCEKYRVPIPTKVVVVTTPRVFTLALFLSAVAVAAEARSSQAPAAHQARAAKRMARRMVMGVQKQDFVHNCLCQGGRHPWFIETVYHPAQELIPIVLQRPLIEKAGKFQHDISLQFRSIQKHHLE